MRMDDRSMVIELRSISCKGVTLLFNLFQKPSLYALVSVTGQHNNKKKKTPIDRKGGENPEWDHPIRLDGVDPSLAIEFELKASRILGDTTVGTVRIPVADLDLDLTSASVKQASYQVRGPDGRPNGVLTLSYKIDGTPDADAVKPDVAPVSISNHEVVKYPDVWDDYPPPPPPSAAAQAFGYYPPPPTDPAVSFVQRDYEHQGWSAQPPPAYGGYYPPPSPAAEQYYPPPPPAAPAPAFGYYPPPPTDPAVSFMPRDYEHHQVWSAQPPPAYGGYYPPPPPPAGYYPPQAAPACCYSGPRAANGGRTDA